MMFRFFSIQHFLCERDVTRIYQAMEEYHQRTCLQFRWYDKSIDKDYISFQSSKPGCWSSVGRQGAGQAINLQLPKCIRHGSIIHEIMHAIGFHHQHSTYNRDEYIEVVWENIKTGKQKNFKKYEEDTVTDFGVGYDYKSIMHYSRKVFSANGKPTIIPKEEGVKIGQREKLSDKDVLKIQGMYKNECSTRHNVT
ncbi:zinc metalloproteinase nas-4-like isoform X2 [Fopius arisanus]|uniref:Metalloendopeptidase n=1 Tax=Fopius arisanus TaxID=64838 RepID=A0A9R1T078_9HYME|nr:PREDICTED: zinc metalloproteinase nas-4-like isoform X2 [Fopius arisanus]